MVARRRPVDLAAARYPVALAICAFDYGNLLLERDSLGDSEKAVELQDEAISIATELGMKPLLERVLAKRASFGEAIVDR